MKKLKTVYLAGPIEKAGDQGLNWRKKIIPSLKKLGFTIYDPVALEKNKTGYNIDKALKIIDSLKKKKNKKKFIEFVSRIQDFDITLVRKVDFLIVYFPEGIFSSGTTCEIWDAYIYPQLTGKEKKPILAVGNFYKIPSWTLCTIYRTGGRVFCSFSELLKFLRKVKK